MSDKQYKTYDTARFHIPDGMYSIEEIEKMLRMFRDAREMQSASLKRSMQPTKDQ